MLTEVVEAGPPEAFEATVLLGAPVDVAGEPTPAPDAAEALAGRVLHALQPQIDALLEARLREALAPALARAADALVRDARHELAQALQALVNDAVARALRQRAPPR